MSESQEGDSTPQRSTRTKYFQLDEDSESRAPEETCGKASEESTAAFDEERRQLEMSKVNFQRTVQRQQQVEQSVCSLLKRLDELPDGADATPPVSPSDKDGGSEPQLKAAVAGLAAAGLNVMPLREVPTSPESGVTSSAKQLTSPPKEVQVQSPQPEEPAAAAKASAGKGNKPSTAVTPDKPPGPGRKNGVLHSPSQDLSASSQAAAASPSKTVSTPQRAPGSTPPPKPAKASPSKELGLPIPKREASPPVRSSQVENSPPAAAQPASVAAQQVPEVKALTMSSFASPDPKVRSGHVLGSSSSCRSPEAPLTPGPSPSSGVTFASPVAEEVSPPSEEADEPVAESPTALSSSSPVATDFKTPMAWSSQMADFSLGNSPGSSSSAGATPSSASRNIPVEQGPRLSGHSPADGSLLAPSSKAAENDQWRGWSVQTSADGKLFYHHAASSTSQWSMPRELAPVLGEWTQAGEEGSLYWRNEHLGVSSWKDPRRTTNLFQAALDGNLFFLQLYTEVGGFLDAVDGKGRTALHYNCAGGSSQAVLYLLQHGATVDVQDQSGSTPLHWSCRYGHAPIVRLLLESRANPDCQNGLGDTPMHEAAALGLVDPLHWLVHAKANPHLRNRESRTPAEVAERARAPEALDLLQRLEGGELDESEADPFPSPKASRRHKRRSVPEREQVLADPDPELDEGSTDEEREPSLALVLVRAARPVLRSVQWLANRVLGEKKTNLGDSNKFAYDSNSGQWVLQRQEVAELDEEFESGSSGEEGVQTWSSSDPGRFGRLRGLSAGRPSGGESDGGMA